MKKILIAGGTSGIGLATAKLFVKKGNHVIILGRNEDKLKEALWELGNSAEGYVLDVRDKEILKEKLKLIGTIDHLIIAVSGAKGRGLFRELNLDVLKQGFEEKFFAQLQMAQLAVDQISKEGSIVFVTAISSQAKLVGTSGLGAINGALETMVPVLAKELKPIRVNAVSPGVVDTAWWDFLSPEEKKNTFEQLGAMIPVGRVGQPEEIASAIEMLIENTFINGHVLVADGGTNVGQ